MKREHFGLCRVITTNATGSGQSYRAPGGYPSMEGAISVLDPFQDRDHYSLFSAGKLVALTTYMRGDK